MALFEEYTTFTCNIAIVQVSSNPCVTINQIHTDSTKSTYCCSEVKKERARLTGCWLSHRHLLFGPCRFCYLFDLLLRTALCGPCFSCYPHQLHYITLISWTFYLNVACKDYQLNFLKNFILF